MSATEPDSTSDTQPEALALLGPYAAQPAAN